MYSKLPIFAEWSYKGFQCRIVDSEPGAYYRTAAFVVTEKGAIHHVPLGKFDIKQQLIELWIDAGCPLEQNRYDAYQLEKLRAAQDGSSLPNIASFEFHKIRRDLEVKFNNGTIYQYTSVPHEIYAGLLKAEHVEEYFYTMIHNEYPRSQVNTKGALKKSTTHPDEIDLDYSIDEYNDHDLDFGQWIDLGGERMWDSYTDDD